MINMELVKFIYNCAVKETLNVDVESLMDKYETFNDFIDAFDDIFGDPTFGGTIEVVDLGDESEFCEDTYYELERIWETKHPK